MPSLSRPLVLVLILCLGLAASPLTAVTFRLALVGPAWNPGDRVSEPWLQPLVLAVGDGLIGFDSQTGLVKPGLAASWTASPDRRSWTFVLKKARWSDGRPITAEDFVAAWGPLAEVETEAVDSATFRAVFREPLADVAVLAAPRFFLLPAASGPGAGPFMASPPTPGLPLVLERNARFREASAVKIDRIEVFFFRSFSEADAWYRDGRLDWIPRGRTSDRGLQGAVVAPGRGRVFLRFNLGDSRLADPAFRKRLSQAVDRPALAQGLRGPVLLPLGGSPPAGGTPLASSEPLVLLHPVGETYRSIAQGLADQWRRRLGLVVETQQLPFAEVQARRTGDFSMLLGSWREDYPDPTDFFRLFVSSRFDSAGFANPSFDALLQRLEGLAPGKERNAVIQQAQVLLEAELPVLPLLAYASTNQINLRRWSGWTANPSDLHPWQGMARR